MPYDPEIQKEVNRLISHGNSAGVGRLAQSRNLSDAQVDTYIKNSKKVPVDRSYMTKVG